MAGRNFFGQPSLGEGNGGSSTSSSIRQWISPDEFRRRFESRINAIYPGTSANQVQEGMRMGSPCYLSSPLFCSLPRTVVQPWRDAHGLLHHPSRSPEDLTLQLVPGSSSSSSSLTFPPTFSNPSGFYFPQRGKMSVGTENEIGCDLELRLSTGWSNEGQSNAQKNKRPRFTTKLLLGEEAEEEGGPRNNKARTDSAGSGSAASGSSTGSCSGEEIDQELRLSL